MAGFFIFDNKINMIYNGLSVLCKVQNYRKNAELCNKSFSVDDIIRTIGNPTYIEEVENGRTIELHYYEYPRWIVSTEKVIVTVRDGNFWGSWYVNGMF